MIIMGLIVVVLVLGLAVLLFDELGHEEATGGELLDVGNVVVLSNVNPSNRAYYEGETAPYYPHRLRYATVQLQLQSPPLVGVLVL